MSETTITWRCMNYPGDQPVLDHTEMMVHMREVHKIDTKATKAQSQAIMFMDGRGFAAQTYEITVGELKFMKYVHIEYQGADQ